MGNVDRDKNSSSFQIVFQNQGLLVKSLEDKDQFIDDERAFS